MVNLNVGSQFAWTSGGRIAAAAVQALTYLIIARDAGPDSFAIVALTVGLATVLQSVFDLGVSTFVVRERARNEDSSFVGQALVLNRYTSAGLAIFSLSAVLMAAMLVDRAYLLILPLIIWIGGERFIETRLGIALADGRAGAVSRNLLIRRIVALSTYVCLASLRFEPLQAFSISFTIGTVAGAIHMKFRVPYRALQAGLVASQARSVIRLSVPFWVNSTVTQLRNLDVLVVTAVAGSVAGGLYGIVARSIGPLRILASSLSAVILPTASRKSPLDLRSLRRPIIDLGCCLVIFYVVTTALVPIFVPLFLGDEYELSVLPMQVVVVSLIFAAGSSILNALLQANGREWVVANVSVLASFGILVGCAFGASISGALGSALAVGVGFFVQFVVLIALFCRGISCGEQGKA